MAVEAMEEPERVEKSTPPATAMRLSLPGTLPIHLSRVSIMLRAIS